MIHDVTSERNHKLRRLSSPFNGPNKLWQEPIVANEKIIALGALCVCVRGRASVFLAGKLTHSD
jgi:hypothetical protein